VLRVVDLPLLPQRLIVGHLNHEAHNLGSKQCTQLVLGCLGILDRVVQRSSRKDRRIGDSSQTDGFPTPPVEGRGAEKQHARVGRREYIRARLVFYPLSIAHIPFSFLPEVKGGKLMIR
jgi:hypothetical protein